MSADFEEPANKFSIEIEIKKSRFIAWAYPANSREAAMEHLSGCRDEYPDARHHCWAYLIGDPRTPKTVAMSDDGEPSGTAGKPILNVLQHKSVGNIMLVVVRYFGGIKLGAGGLVRAYSSAAQTLITQLPTKTHVACVQRVVHGDYSLEQTLRHWLSSNGGEVIDVRYASEVEYHISFPLRLEEVFRLFASNQRIRFPED